MCWPRPPRATPGTAPTSCGPPRTAIGTDIELIGGTREAELSALGVASSFHQADGVVGDLGGGSLELIEVKRLRLGRGVSLPLGGLALADRRRTRPSAR